MSDENYLIREAGKDDTNDVLALLKENYLYKENFTQSYISKHVNEFSQEEKEIFESDAMALLKNILSSVPCLVVVHRESGKIVGSLVLEHFNSTKEQKSTFRQKNEISSKILRDIFSYLEIVYKNSGVFERFLKATKILHFDYLCADENHRQKNLSTMLMKESVKWCKENKYDVVYGLFTSAFSKKAAANAGLKSIFECDIQNIRDSQGLSVFADVAPHNVISIMAIDFNN